MPATTVVVPCYNEAARLDARGLLELLADLSWSLVLVNDGSTDSTSALLRALAEAHPGKVRVLDLERNQGKAEAVRRGLLLALEGGAERVAYFDADLATPPAELRRVIAALDAPGVYVALGARVALLGAQIERKPARHYLGRIFASGASLALRLPVYDTQCGAKAFRAVPQLAQALATPFRSRWIFDVELISRLLTGCEGKPNLSAQNFVEVPLQQWRDVRGSKLHPAGMLRAGLDLAVLAWSMRR